MLKYVAILEVDYPRLAGQWHSGNIHKRFKSPIEEDKSKVEEWVQEKIKEYPYAIVNRGRMYTEIVINYCIIPFEETEAVNMEYMLERLRYQPGN